MMGIFKRIARAGFTISPGFVFVPFDLNLGQDILDPANARKVDIFAVHFIAKHDHRFRKNHSAHPALKKSPFDFGVDSWAQAALRMKPKIMASFVLDRDDIDVAQFNLHGEYLPIPQRRRVRGLSMSLLVDRDYSASAKTEPGL